MKKLYFIAPIIGVLIFAVIFWRFNADFDVREKEKADIIRLDREAKLRADTELKKKAIEDANALQEQRKVEKAEREKRAEEEKATQLALNDESTKARDERDRVLRQVDRIQGEIKIEKEALDKLDKDKAELVAEDEFQLKYLPLAETNRKNLEEVLTKIEKIDKEAAAAALIAGKKKS